MSRYQGRLDAAATDSGDDRNASAALGDLIPASAKRAEMIAQYLSAATGWRDAGDRLGGAFAGGEAVTPRSTKTGLSDGKEK